MKWRSLCFRLLASTALAAALLASIDVRGALRPIPRVGWIDIALMALLTNADRWLMSYKWNLLLRARSIEARFSSVIRSYYVGTLWGMFLPTAIGGDVVRSLSLRPGSRRMGEVLSSIVLERALGLASSLCLGIVAALALPLVIDHPSENRIAALLLVPLVAVFAALVLSFSELPTRRLRGPTSILPEGTRARLGEVVRSYRLYGRDRALLGRFFLWSLAEQCIPAVCVFLVARAIGTEARFVEVLTFVPLIMIPSRLPISLDGFGVREGLFVYFFGLAGVPAGEALRLGFLSHVLGLIALFPGFLAAWLTVGA